LTTKLPKGSKIGQTFLGGVTVSSLVTIRHGGWNDRRPGGTMINLNRKFLVELMKLTKYYSFRRAVSLRGKAAPRRSSFSAGLRAKGAPQRSRRLAMPAGTKKERRHLISEGVDCVRSIEETAAILDLDPQNLRGMIKRGEGPKVIWLSVGRCGIRDSDREKWLRKRPTSPQPYSGRPRGRPRKAIPTIQQVDEVV
jgi:hypothetical protein